MCSFANEQAHSAGQHDLSMSIWAWSTGNRTVVLHNVEEHERFRDELPRYHLRDRDHVFDHVKTIGIQEVLTAPGSPWQNA